MARDADPLSFPSRSEHLAKPGCGESDEALDLGLGQAIFAMDKVDGYLFGLERLQNALQRPVGD
jgi:hypothetical protein